MKGVYPVTAYGIVETFLHIAFVAAWFGGASLIGHAFKGCDPHRRDGTRWIMR